VKRPAASRLVYGVGPVRELVAARPGAIEVLYVDGQRADARGKDPVAELTAAARRAGVKVVTSTSRELDAMVGPDARHQGAVVQATPLRLVDVDDILATAAARGEAPLVVVLDGVTDPHNLGAIIRSTYVLGGHGVIIPEHRAAGITPVVTKASAGATELLPLCVAGNLVRALEDLKAGGVWATAVAATERARPLRELDLRGPTALVMGSEGDGVRALVAKTCDFHGCIPMSQTGVGSLNVSVAAGIALYEATRQRT
jgi:23S rRNA (guanosine2251-2'-O)-methyltransferase